MIDHTLRLGRVVDPAAALQIECEGRHRLLFNHPLENLQRPDLVRLEVTREQVLEKHMHVQLILRRVMSQLDVLICERHILVRISSIFIAKMQVVAPILFEDGIYIPNLMQQHILSVLKLLNLFILWVADWNSFW
jgi:hypothetical protein